MVLPREIARVLSSLGQKGIGAYIVGGAVRDFLMGREPYDFDIAAECTPGELLAAFEGWHCFDNSIRFGTLNVISGEYTVEITCCRRESGYSDLRRPDSVEFCKSITEDLARRDFTVNAVAMGADGVLIDPFGGREDVKAGIIRTVGEADRRFGEDALRILRALRFASTLGFTVEEDTRRAMEKNAHLLKSISGERIYAELVKLLLGDNVLRVLLENSAIICEIIPELLPAVGFEQNNPHHIYTVYGHTARAVAACPKDKNIRLCMLFHDIAKPRMYTVDEKGIGHFYGHPEKSAEMAKEILRRLHADGETVKNVCFLIKYHDTRPAATRKSLMKYLSRVGFEGARQLLAVRRADLSAQSPEYHDQFEYLLQSERMIDEFEAEDACISVSKLKINGRDIIALGAPAGPVVGEVLDALFKKVISGETENEKDALTAAAKRIVKKKI